MNKDEVWKQIESQSDAPWTEHEADELRALLGNSTVQRALKLAMLPLNEQSHSMLGLNLEDPAQRAEATNIQGRVRGSMELVGYLMDLAEEEEQSNG